MMKKNPIPAAKILLLTIAIASIFAFGYFIGVVPRTTNARGVTLGSSRTNIQGTGQSDLSVNDLQIIAELYADLKAQYINPDLPTKESFISNAAKGFLLTLEDKFTNYYTKAEWEEIQKNNAGEFEGVGIKLRLVETAIQVETPLVGSPAAEAGVMPLDIIKKVDDKDLKGLSLVEVAKLIRGTIGTKVKLEIFRPSDAKEYSFTIERKAQQSKSVTYKENSGGVVISIARFIGSSPIELQQQWDEAVNFSLEKQAKFIVLDLRNNTGGWVSSAKYVLEDFLPNQTTFLKEVDRNGKEDVLQTQRQGKLVNIPLAVIVNEGSASASEIVAGALQDYKRAQLIGKSTTGKGVEQTMVSTSDGGVLFVVFKRWYTPNGKNLSADKALQPDQTVELTADDVKIGQDPQLLAGLKILGY